VIHHPESGLRPQQVGGAHGAPWSVRIASGRPSACNRRATIGLASPGLVGRRTAPLQRNRLYASATGRGEP
jgi:hypothetical protein